MFRGQSEHALDAKNRLTIPARFREELGEVFFVTKGLDNCLFVFSGGEWEKFEAKLLEQPLSTGRNAHRYFFSGACECTLDKMGRILLPPHLKDHAFIEKDVVIVGVASRLEVWSKARWEAYNTCESFSDEEIAAQLELLQI